MFFLHLHTSINYRTFLKDFFYFIIIYPQLKQNLIFIFCKSAFQFILCLLICQSALYKTPKTCIILIIDMAINLSPRQIISHIFITRIANTPWIKHRNVKIVISKKFFKIKSESWRKTRNHTRIYFITSSPK